MSGNAPADSPSYLDPVLLARIARLQLRAQTVVEGFVAGQHQSPARGHSVEFAQHREYAAGDELKHLDWKVFGRTDRLVVKQFEEETNLRLQLFLDVSGSMAFKGSRSAFSKYDYAATLAASLAYLALRQGDSVGLAASSSFGLRQVPPRTALAHLTALLGEMEHRIPSGETRLAEGLELTAHASRRRSLVVVFSDLLDEPESVLKALKLLCFKKHEVKVVQLLDRDELDFPYRGPVRFESLERGEALELEAESFRAEYRREARRMIESYRAGLRNVGAAFAFHTTDEPMDHALRSVLRR